MNSEGSFGSSSNKCAYLGDRVINPVCPKDSSSGIRSMPRLFAYSARSWSCSGEKAFFVEEKIGDGGEAHRGALVVSDAELDSIGAASRRRSRFQPCDSKRETRGTQAASSMRPRSGWDARDFAEVWGERREAAASPLRARLPSIRNLRLVWDLIGMMMERPSLAPEGFLVLAIKRRNRS